MEQHFSTENCDCGKIHTVSLDAVVTGSGALERLPEFVRKYGAKKPFILADANTFTAVGERVCRLLESGGISFGKYVFPCDHLKPDDKAVGSAVLHFDHSCDLIVGVGSGVINDLGKILSQISGRKYIVVATAPSMDGYASDSASMTVDNLKVSVPCKCASVIIGDTDILRNAPEHLLKAGLGDMLAKYVSIAEWRIAHLITGEYYCEKVAQLIRKAVKKCVDNAAGLLKRDEKAVETVFEGLVLGGISMAYAGVSRPASGVEHYFSHVWDMRTLEFGTKTDLHGIQCAVGTLLAAKLYDALRKITPDADKAKAYVNGFSYEAWKTELWAFLGKSAETMIAQEEKEQKYDKSTHPARFARIAENWETILQILDEELPTADEIEKILETIGVSTDLRNFSAEGENVKLTFKATKDIRDKYVLSRLAWDLGVLEELCQLL